jgi:hypothetical protein
VVALEELANSLRPLELLTKNLCKDQFTVLQADTIFQTAFRALASQNTFVGDSLLTALKTRYAQRKNIKLLSCLHFLIDPLEYNPGEDGLLELTELRSEVTNICTRLYPDPDPEPAADLEQEADTEGRLNEHQLSDAEKLAAQFSEDLQSIGQRKKKTSPDVTAEMKLACKTGNLTDRLQNLLRALESIQASSVEAERAFSTASRFVTKVKNRLGDKTLDSYCFANHKFKMESRLVAIIIFFTILKFSPLSFAFEKPFCTHGTYLQVHLSCKKRWFKKEVL